jgi:uncharacterized delta-60 repeat protein
MTNKTNFIGWSGKTSLSNWDFSKLNLTRETQSITKTTSKIIEGVVNVDRSRPIKSKVNPSIKLDQSEVQTPEPTPDFSKATKLKSIAKAPLMGPIITCDAPLAFTAGTVDYCFPKGVNTGFNDEVRVIKIQPDGKILVGGVFEYYYDTDGSQYYTPKFIRLNSDGSIDWSFLYNTNADCCSSYLDGDVFTIDIQSDGKILVGGVFRNYYENNSGNYYTSNRIARFNSDGSFDDTFFTGDGFDDNVNKIIVQPNGKILVAGNFARYNNSQYNPNDGRSYWRIIRLNQNGTPDLTFNPGYGVDWDNYGYVYDMVLQPDGKIILGGDFYNYNNVYDANFIVRINSDGSYDDTFLQGDGFNDVVNTLALQSDGKIIVGGNFRYYNNVDLHNGYIVRLSSNGDLDTLFGWGLDGEVTSLYVQSDDRIIVGGYMSEYYPDNSLTVYIDELVRFNSDCSFDYGFYYEELFNDAILSIALDSNNKIYVGGSFDNGGDPETFPLNYFGKLNNFISTYPYTYTVDACTQPDYDSTLSYVVGSMVPLEYGKTYSFKGIGDPTVTVCGEVSETYPSNLVDYVVSNSYDNCKDAIHDNSKYVIVLDCISEEPVWLIVDNKYNVGDILYCDLVINNNLNYIVPWETSSFFKFAGTIVEELNWDDAGPVTQLLPSINYSPYASCDDAIEANGVHWVVGDCSPNYEIHFPLIHKSYYQETAILNPTGVNPVKSIYDYVGYGPNFLISDGTPEIYSTIEFNSCEEGLIAMSPSGVQAHFYDGGFNGGLNGPLVYTTVEQTDGKILVGGNFQEYDGKTVNNFMRLYSDGTLDESFNGVYCNQPIWSVETPFNTVTTRFLRWTITKRRGAEADALQASEFVLYANGEPVSWDPSVGVNNPGGDNPGGEVAQRLVDGDTETKWTDLNFWQNGGENPNAEFGQSIIEIDNFNTITFDSYSWATANDFPDRDAVSWTLEVSMDNTEWTLVSQVTNADVTEDRYSYIDPITPSQSYNTTGSIYFDGTPLCGLSAQTDNGVWDLGNNNITFEWFQKFEGDVTTNPILFDYRTNDLKVYFTPGLLNVLIDGDYYSFTLNTDIENVWCHIAITRYYDPIDDEYIWRVFQNGELIGQFLYNYYIGRGNYLVIGNSQYFNYDYSGFNGYITNFRVNNGAALYTENFTVPTAPLNPNFNPDDSNTVLCLSVNNESDYILDSCDDEIPTIINHAGYYIFEGFNSFIKAIAIQEDGKILVGGNFTSYNNEVANRIIRLNPDGSIDQGFTWGSEFDRTVRAIAVQRDGKIVVGGDFYYYYDYYCPQIIRLNPDGSPDTTFVIGDGFGESQVFTINIETIKNEPSFYSNHSAPTYTENIIVGGWFNWYNGTNVGGIVKLSSTGELLPDFGYGFNQDTGGTPRVNKIVKQPDGKLIVIGGADGGYLRDFNNTWIPQNIVRLVNNGGGIYQIDETFTTVNWDGDGGFGGSANGITLLPNGKIMVGGYFSTYGDNNNYHNSIPNLVRLNSDGTLDTTFTFEIDSPVVNITSLYSGALLVGGRFNSPASYLLKLFVGEDYVLKTFSTCDGETSNIYLPNGYSAELIPSLELYDGDYPDDDSNYFVELPLGFDVNFLGDTYSSVNVSTNSYLTFGGGSSSNNVEIPNDIPARVGYPGVFISTRTDSGTCLDSELYGLYTGLVDNGNTFIVRFEGNDDYSPEIDLTTNLIYNFKFYKNYPDYFDLIIESNKFYCNDDSTGGVSNGVDSYWISSFDTSSENSYRIYSDGSYESLTYEPLLSSKPIKANINNSNVVCGKATETITTPNKFGNGFGGSMYFDGTEGTNVTIDYNLAMDLDYESWTIEWFQYYDSPNSCCSRVFDIGSYDREQVGASIEGNTIRVWLKNLDPTSSSPYIFTLSPVNNVWTHIAITAKDIGGGNRILRVFQDGVMLNESDTIIISMDLDNYYPDLGTTLPLTIGSENNGDSPFQGYITNFRWNRGTCYYDANFDVPTLPLSVDGSQLLLLATDQARLTYDSSETQNVTANNVTWSTFDPFPQEFKLYTSTDTTSYDDCSTCDANTYYYTTLYSVDGINPDYITRARISKSDMEKIMTLGPIFKYRKPIAYKVLNYKL